MINIHLQVGHTNKTSHLEGCFIHVSLKAAEYWYLAKHRKKEVVCEIKRKMRFPWKQKN